MAYEELSRFTEAQESSYANALREIKNGKKTSHWMWYIFPQLKGLGFTETSHFYGIKDLDEAKAYLNHPVLGKRLNDICIALLDLPSSNASVIFGNPDDLKLRSSMTLFAISQNDNPIFDTVLSKFFNGEKDHKTLQMLRIAD